MADAAQSGAAAPGENILVAEDVTKVFPGVVANDAGSGEIRRAEIHCLLGENGAGKTTLADILYGVYQPDDGRVLLEGKPLELHSPRDAIEAGIGMVHQHFELVPPMSVIENVVIGTQAKQWLDLTEARRRLEEFFADYDVEIDPDAEVGRLSVGEQQWVEIFKTLYFGVEILILDEPTAVLTPQGIDELFRILRRMRDEGLTIILITHKLKEVMDLSDRVT
ncbi:MAG: ATP-binding cassette domain-containing protein, partial [Acidimicrobiaceae bacterium]|nr:ATP-binding cassette domain-containing protein [Acidimicrobiaceae bacterium]